MKKENNKKVFGKVMQVTCKDFLDEIENYGQLSGKYRIYIYIFIKILKNKNKITLIACHIKIYRFHNYSPYFRHK